MSNFDWITCPGQPIKGEFLTTLPPKLKWSAMNIAPAVYQKIIAAKVFMDQNFHESIDLDTISREACISRFHFHRLFTRVYKKTPHQYITGKRIALACDLLAGKKMTVTEICNSVGFESMGSFSVLFKKETGMGPRFFRNVAWYRNLQAEKCPASLIPQCFIDSLSLA